MNYLILGHASNRIMLFALLHPQDSFYIYTNNLDAVLCELDENYIDGKKYILDNVHFTLNMDKILDGILWDDFSLSIEQVNAINDYLSLDKPVYVGNIYCEELQQLKDYQYFMGNSGCLIPKDSECDYTKPITFIKFEPDIIKCIEYYQALVDDGYTLVTLGDCQKLVDEQHIKVVKLTENFEEDINNLTKVLSIKNQKTIFIPTLSNNSLSEYQISIIDKVHELYDDNSNSVLIINAVLLNNYLDNIDKNKTIQLYSKIYVYDSCRDDHLFFEQYPYSILGFARLKNDYSQDNKINNLDIHVLRPYFYKNEYLNPFSMPCIYSYKYRSLHPELYPDPLSISSYNVVDVEKLYADTLQTKELL